MQSALAAPRRGAVSLPLLRPPMPRPPRLLRPAGRAVPPLPYARPHSPTTLCRALWGRGGKKAKDGRAAEEEEELEGDWADEDGGDASDTPYALSPAEEVAAEKAAYSGHVSGVAEAEEEEALGEGEAWEEAEGEEEEVGAQAATSATPTPSAPTRRPSSLPSARALRPLPGSASSSTRCSTS